MTQQQSQPTDLGKPTGSVKKYKVLLYYKYVRIEEHEAYAAHHLRFCKELGVKGRILIAREGINGTLSGTPEQADRYIEHMRQDPRFADIVWKTDESDEHVFKKLFVRAKDELVTFRLPYDLDPNEITGQYLKPAEWKEMMQQEDVVIVDARTDYEYDIGHFKGAIRPEGVTSFREFPEWVRENLTEHKEKKILAYCTGGIRCEKFTGFLLKEGFKNVFHLEGGIVTYGKDPETQGELWDGKCYVFDERIVVPVGEKSNPNAGQCKYCGEPNDVIQNCANLSCRSQIVVCPKCEAEHKRACSDACRDSERNVYPYRTKKEWLAAQESLASTHSETP
jgi:UPF0176 protein